VATALEQTERSRLHTHPQTASISSGKNSGKTEIRQPMDIRKELCSAMERKVLVPDMGIREQPTQTELEDNNDQIHQEHTHQPGTSARSTTDTICSLQKR